MTIDNLQALVFSIWPVDGYTGSEQRIKLNIVVPNRSFEEILDSLDRQYRSTNLYNPVEPYTWKGRSRVEVIVPFYHLVIENGDHFAIRHLASQDKN
jgi:hypothetical protein